MFVVYVASLNFIVLPSSSPLNAHPFRRPQIAGLIVKKALTKISAEYSDFADIFSSNLVSKLPKHTRINNYAIELVDG